MTRYYAHITGAANISVPVNPGQIYTGNSKHITLEFNGDNLRTDSTRKNGAVFIRNSGNWFSFEMYGQGWEYFNIAGTTYIGRNGYWSTNGFEETLVADFNNGNYTLTKGQTVSAGTFSDDITASDMTFFKSGSATNTLMNFYRQAIYAGDNKTLMYEFVPDYSGTTMGLRDNVSGEFYAATDQSKIELISFTVFETNITAITASYSSTTTEVTLTAEEDMAWTASTQNDWITLSTTGGTGSSVFTVSVSKNTAYTGRNGLVTLTNGENTIEITVVQKKYPLFVPSENIYRGDLEVVKGYRSGSLVKKMYLEGDLIYVRLNPPTPPVPPTCADSGLCGDYPDCYECSCEDEGLCGDYPDCYECTCEDQFPDNYQAICECEGRYWYNDTCNDEPQPTCEEQGLCGLDPNYCYECGGEEDCNNTDPYNWWDVEEEVCHSCWDEWEDLGYSSPEECACDKRGNMCDEGE